LEFKGRQVQETMQETSKRRAPRSEYTSQAQLSFAGFETPFYNGVDPCNRWVVLKFADSLGPAGRSVQ